MATATTKSDTHIQTDVQNELRWDPRVEATAIGVSVHQGIVTLSGSIAAFAQKLAAREAAHRVAGVLDVVDEMKVKLPVFWERTDEDIAKAVRSALQWDVLVPDDCVTSTVSSGVVILEGKVNTWPQRWDAERAVHGLTGVRDVINRIAVTAKTVSAEKIREEIEGALERQAEREAKRIGVSVRDGVVTLTGSVRSWGEKNAIDRAAGFAAGVRRVDDRTVLDPYC